MQRPDEKKRAQIVATAAKLFATRPYHKVRLEDIAADAKIGKGTLYIYFDNKEDLYFSLIFEGFAQIVDRLKEQIGHPAPADEGTSASANGHGTAPGRNGARPPNGTTAAAPPLAPLAALERIVSALVRFAVQHPHFFELMRSVGSPKGHSESDWTRKRVEFNALLEQTIRRGNATGELRDPHPELTALFIGGMVRSAMLFAPRPIDEAAVRDQIFRLLRSGIAVAPHAEATPGPDDAPPDNAAPSDVTPADADAPPVGVR